MKSWFSNPCVSHILQITMYVLSFFFLELNAGRMIDKRGDVLIFDVVLCEVLQQTWESSLLQNTLHLKQHCFLLVQGSGADTFSLTHAAVPLYFISQLYELSTEYQSSPA